MNFLDASFLFSISLPVIKSLFTVIESVVFRIADQIRNYRMS